MVMIVGNSFSFYLLLLIIMFVFKWFMIVDGSGS